ncbi:MAG TPA: bifunctional (p)ppGpp synthetase/guanosine-3',5'-bis(diphosphate) 3'-pyrophosphohydrolase, partial [Devosia sp.]|nr:bifunctional (p)ppGpp synthetase/guanosine-3',5'-bis(diphosphate) 3'-pyrophosphohydrolase [Devosia sp.]
EDEEVAAKKLASEMGLKNRAELVTAIGTGEINSSDMQKHAAKLGTKRRRLFPRRRISLPVPKKADGWFSLRDSSSFRFRVPGGQRLRSRGKAALARLDFNTPVMTSPEGVVPGDRMVGILGTDGMLGIYPIHSDALVKKHDEDVAWIDVLWDIDTEAEQLFGVAISMLAANKPGMLAQATATIASCEANIKNLALHMVSPDFYQLVFQLEVRDLVQLTEALTTLRHSAGLHKVQRAKFDEASTISRIDWQSDGSEPRS